MPSLSQQIKAAKDNYNRLQRLIPKDVGKGILDNYRVADTDNNGKRIIMRGKYATRSIQDYGDFNKYFKVIPRRLKIGNHYTTLGVKLDSSKKSKRKSSK